MLARTCLLVIALAGCTVGGGTSPPRTPAAAPPDTMPDEVLDKHDAGRDYDRSHHGGSPGWLSGGNVCGSMCNPCADVTRPDPPPGCLNQIACASGTGGISGDTWLVALAIVGVVRRRRRRRRVCSPP